MSRTHQSLTISLASWPAARSHSQANLIGTPASELHSLDTWLKRSHVCSESAFA